MDKVQGILDLFRGCGDLQKSDDLIDHLSGTLEKILEFDDQMLFLTQESVDPPHTVFCDLFLKFIPSEKISPFQVDFDKPEHNFYAVLKSEVGEFMFHFRKPFRWLSGPQERSGDTIRVPVEPDVVRICQMLMKIGQGVDNRGILESP